MLSELSNGEKVVGIKQVRRAVSAQKAKAVYLALDADPHVTETLRSLCQDANVSVVDVPTMKELGETCGISVGAAAAALVS